MSEQPTNRKLIAIFVIPLALVSVGLVASKKYIDVFATSAELKTKVAHAKRIGLPFTAQELRATFTSRPKDEFQLDRISEEVKQEVRAPKKLSSPTIDANLAEQFKYATEAAKSSTFVDPRDFDSYDYVDVYRGPRQAAKLIVYKARHQATHGDVSGAIDTLSLIRNLGQQMKEDPHIIGLLVNSSLQVEMYRGISEVSAVAKSDRQAQQRLLDLAESDWPLQPLTHALKGEFYLQLGMLRNQLPAVLHMIPPVGARTDEPPLDKSKPVQRSGLPASTVAQGLLSRLIDYYLAVYEVLTSRSDPREIQLLLQAVAEEYAGPSAANQFVNMIAQNAASDCEVYIRQPSWKAIMRWVIEIHRDHAGKFPATLPTRDDPGLGGQLQYRRTKEGFRIYCVGEDETDDGGNYLENGADDFGIDYPRIAPKL